jgi:hypothetical protein
MIGPLRDRAIFADCSIVIFAAKSYFGGKKTKSTKEKFDRSHKHKSKVQKQKTKTMQDSQPEIRTILPVGRHIGKKYQVACLDYSWFDEFVGWYYYNTKI